MSRDDRALNPLRLVVLALILGYFGWLLWPKPSANPAPEPPASMASPTVMGTPSRSQIQEESGAMPRQECAGRIRRVAGGPNELRLEIEGVGKKILVYTEQGTVVALTETSGSAGEYRVRTPAPATAVQLDDCPAINLP
ncbi:MAG: hypothetical protein C4327_12930 [Meiothermus sp.]